MRNAWLPLLGTMLSMTSCYTATSKSNLGTPPVSVSTIDRLAEDVVWHDKVGLVFSLAVESFYVNPSGTGLTGSVHVDNPSNATLQMHFTDPERLEVVVYDAATREVLNRSVSIYPPGGRLNLPPGDHENLSFEVEVPNVCNSQPGVYTVAARLGRSEQAWLSASVDSRIPVDTAFQRNESRCPGRRVPSPVLESLVPLEDPR